MSTKYIQDAPAYLPKTTVEAFDFQPQSWILAAMEDAAHGRN